MLFDSVEPSKWLHHVVYLSFFFASNFLEFWLLTDIKQLPTDDEFLPVDSFRQLLVVDIDESKLHLPFFLSIILIELHLGKEELSFVIIFDLKVTSSWEKTYDFSRIGSSFQGGIVLTIDCEVSPLVFIVGAFLSVFLV